MSRRMLINALESEEVRIAVLEDGILQEYYVERESKETLVGNVYKGKVLNIHQGLQAAFVDIGIDKNAFLHASEIPGPITYDEEGREQRPSGAARHITNLVQSGQEVLVQVIRDAVDAKGPSVSMDISLPGRYLVVTPRTPRVAVSKRISDPAEREDLKRLLLDLHPPEGLGFIIRTAGADRSGLDLQRDLDYLIKVWNAISRRAKAANPPAVIYQESDLVIRTIRDMFTPEVSEIVTDHPNVHNRVLDFFQTLMPRYVQRVKYYEETEPLFHRYNVESQIDQIYERRVNLKSGGTIVIEPTEALVSVDVNSGKFTRESSPEEMAYRTNMEAAAEIARQLRLRDLGGQIVVDFIDMRDPRHRRNVERTLKDAIRKDRAQATILRTSRLGLVEMARQKIHPGIRVLSFEPCGHCKGSGYVKTVESAALGLLRQIRLVAPRHEVTGLKVYCASDVAHYVNNVKRPELEKVEEKADKPVTVLGERETPVERYEIFCVLHGGTEVPLEEMNFKPLPPPPELPTPAEPPEETAEEAAAEERGVLEEQKPEPNEWQLPIEPPEGEAEEPVRPAAQAPVPDFEEDVTRFEERVTQPTQEGTAPDWRSRVTPRPMRRPDASFHDKRQVRRPMEEPRQPVVPQEPSPEPQGLGQGPSREEGRPVEAGRGEGFRGREERGGRRGWREERGFRGGRGRDEGRRDGGERRDAAEGRGAGFRREERAPYPQDDSRRRDLGRGPARGDRMGRPQEPEDEWAVEEEFDADLPQRREGRGQPGSAPQRGEGRDESHGYGREDLAFDGGRMEREDRGLRDEVGGERPRRRRRRGGRGRGRGRGRDEMRGGYREDRGAAPRMGGYAPYDDRGQQAPRGGFGARDAGREQDEDRNGWEPEQPRGVRRDEGGSRDTGEPRAAEGGPRMGSRDEERGLRRDQGWTREGGEVRGAGGRRDRGGFREERGPGRGYDEERAPREDRGQRDRYDSYREEEPRRPFGRGPREMDRDQEREASDSRGAAESRGVGESRGAGDSRGAGREQGFRRESRMPDREGFHRPEPFPRRGREPLAPRGEEAPRQDLRRAEGETEEPMTREGGRRPSSEGRPQGFRPRREPSEEEGRTPREPEVPAVAPQEPAPAPAEATPSEAQAPQAEEDEEVGVGFHRKATRRRGRGRRGTKARGGLGAALEGDSSKGGGEAAPPAPSGGTPQTD